MKKLIINVLCFSIIFNGFIGIMSKTAHALEDHNQKAVEQNEKDKDWRAYYKNMDFKNIDKRKASILATTLIGVGTGAFLIFKCMRRVPKAVVVNEASNPSFEEEEQEISDGAI